MDKKICPECKTENEKDYIYCKNCGTLLTDTVKQTPEPKPETAAATGVGSTAKTPSGGGYSVGAGGENTGGNSSYNPYSMYSQFSFKGVPGDDIAVYVGKKATEYIPKFIKMEYSGTKTSWCWPAAVLGFLLGPMGAALWFYYRKMYKTAAVLSVIGAAVTLLSSVLTVGMDSEFMDNAVETFLIGGWYSLADLIAGANPGMLMLSLIGGSIEGIAEIATAVITGLFGTYSYKEHCIRSVRNYCASANDNRYYRIGLSAKGGVSGGMLAMGILLIVAVVRISAFAAEILSAYI